MFLTIIIIVSYSTLRIAQTIFILRKESFAQFKRSEKMIGHHARFQENDNSPAIRKKAPFFNIHLLIMCEIIHSN